MWEIQWILKVSFQEIHVLSFWHAQFGHSPVFIMGICYGFGGMDLGINWPNSLALALRWLQGSEVLPGGNLYATAFFTAAFPSFMILRLDPWGVVKYSLYLPPADILPFLTMASP